MIDILNRNINCFRNLRNASVIINSFDIDNQFASVIDYLNDVIVLAINDMQNEVFAGIIDSPNYFLSNIGDGSVEFRSLADIIRNNSIDLNKIEKVIPNALVYTDLVKKLSLLTESNNNMLVTAQENSLLPEFSFITTNYIEDRAITYADIVDNAITKEHLDQEILDIIDAAVPDETVIEFGDFSITTDKFVANTIDSYTKLGIIHNVVGGYGTGDTIPSYNKTITPDLMPVITPNKLAVGSVRREHFDLSNTPTYGLFYLYGKNKLASGILKEGTWRPDFSGSIGSSGFGGYGISRLCSKDFRLPREKIGIINYAVYFSKEVRDAFRRFGIT